MKAVFNRMLQWSMLIFSLLAAGFSYWQLSLDERISKRMPLALDGSDVVLIAKVRRLDRAQSGALRLMVEAESLMAGPEEMVQLPHTVRISYYPKPQDDCSLQIGERYMMAVRLKAIRNFYNPTGFDYEYWALANGVDVTGYLKRYWPLGQMTKPSKPYCAAGQTLRQRLLARANQLPGLAGAILPALLWGDGQSLGREYWQHLQLTGTVHLLVVSGLHMSFWVLLVLGLWRGLMRLRAFIFRTSSIALIRLEPLALIMMLGLYCQMAGWGVSLQRAYLMLLIAICCRYFFRRSNLLQLYLLALMVGFLLNPLGVRSAGFVYSYAAVLALLIGFAGRPIRSAFAAPGALLRAQLILLLVLTPLYWGFLQPQSINAVIINLIAVPLLALFILPLSILVYVFPSSFLVDFFNQALGFLLFVLQRSAADPQGLHFSAPGVWLLFAFGGAIIWLVFRNTAYRLPLLLLGTLLLMSPVRSTTSSIVVFDVGQGLSVLVKSADYSGVYDAGALYASGFSVGSRVVAPNLRAMGIERLDTMIVSHEDNDHAGGLPGLESYVAIDQLIVGQDIHHPQQIECRNQGAAWRESEAGLVRWRLLNQQRPLGASDNNQSCVVQYEVAGRRLLLAGDIDKSIESELIDHFGGELKSDVLILAHHGSRTSSSLSWLQQVSPQVAIVSAGFNHRFGHPHPDVVERIGKLGIRLLNTAEHGAVEVEVAECDQHAGCLKITPWRQAGKRYWQQK